MPIQEDGRKRIVRVTETITAYNPRTGRFDGEVETRILPIEITSWGSDEPENVATSDALPRDREKRIAERRAQFRLVKIR